MPEGSGQLRLRLLMRMILRRPAVKAHVIRWRLVATGWLWLLAACGESSQPGSTSRSSAQVSGPVVSVLDSVLLSEPISAPLGGYTSFWGIAESGRIYIADISNQRVAVFGKDGRYLRDLGAAGAGPGELSLPVAAIPLSGTDSVVIVDANRQVMLFFVESTGMFVSESRVPFRLVGTSVIAEEDGFTFVSAIEEHPFTKWSTGDGQFRPFGDPIDIAVPAWQRIAMASGTAAAVVADSILATWQPALGLWLFDRAGRRIGHLPVPHTRRKGEGPVQISEQFRLAEAGAVDSSVISAAIGMGHTRDGLVFVGSQDADRVRLSNGAVREDNIRAYLSVISEDWKSACVDGLLPVATDVPAPVLSQNGSIYYLGRRVGGDDRVNTVVYRLEVSTAGCDWVPLGDPEGLVGPTP